jgi:stage II sporulation protein AA (anti-sigma F factor antagonist)
LKFSPNNWTGEKIMLIHERSINNSTVLNISGWFDRQAKEEIQAILEHLDENHSSQLIINLEQVSYMDSAGVGYLCMLYQTLQKRGIQFSLLNPQPDVRQILRLAGIGNLAQIFTSEHEALAAN